MRLVECFKRVPMRAFVGVQLGTERHTLADDRRAIGLALNHEGQRAALALAQNHHHAVVGVPVGGQALRRPR